ncbi:MAG: ABC transporter ATP-binding protein [Methanofollis sp.]|uniref:ABC transporter ATP-binding protein n=1 Tax=Methanofollis sp. TaxID=2052835 RepID=UPI00261362B0|nr:ABC transporter ATP-binding protein [Methanofollis sp.]MDD4254854.1 ABC transporter ATP-binding protein [Methanofollis sp.]
MILSVAGVRFEYQSTPVLEDVSFRLPENETLTILGPNGVGKTTLLKCINTILRPSGGAVEVAGESVLAMKRLEIARKIGYVPQRSETGRLTAFDAILLGRKPHLRFGPGEKDMRIVDDVIRRMHLEPLMLRYIDEMSGGELQKVSIARALVQEPRLLLLDEPTNSLDLRNQMEILRILTAIVRNHHVSAVMTMHDLNLALRFSDRFIFMKGGTILAAGGREVIRPDVIEEVYGLEVAIEWYRGHPLVIPLGDDDGEGVRT